MKDEEGNLVDKWTPCSPGDPSAVEKTWTDIGEKELQEPPLGVSHSNTKTPFVSACLHLSSLAVKAKLVLALVLSFPSYDFYHRRVSFSYINND